jgi:hypothetical protein
MSQAVNPASRAAQTLTALTAKKVTMTTYRVRIVKRKTQGRRAMGLGSQLRCRRVGESDWRQSATSPEWKSASAKHAASHAVHLYCIVNLNN